MIITFAGCIYHCVTQSISTRKIFNQLQQDIEQFFFDRISNPWKYSDTLSQGGKGVIANEDLWN